MACSLRGQMAFSYSIHLTRFVRPHSPTSVQRPDGQTEKGKRERWRRPDGQSEMGKREWWRAGGRDCTTEPQRAGESAEIPEFVKYLPRI